MTRVILIFLWLVAPCMAVVTSDHHVLVDSHQRPIVLAENPDAADPTWAQLYAFLRASAVNRHPYVPGDYVCMEFAQQLQHDAAMAGLRAGIAYIEFTQEPNHAVVVFHTELGYVYADYTGDTRGPDTDDNFQTIGYLVQGQYYGRLPLEVAKQDPVHYDFFARIQQLWRKMPDYRARLDQENERLQAEHARLEEQRKTLDRARKDAVDAFNAQIGRLNQASDDLRQKTDVYNATLGYLRVNYEINPYPVRRFDIWWP